MDISTYPIKLSSNVFSKLLGGTGGGCCDPFEVFPLLSLILPREDLFANPFTCVVSFVAPGTCRISGRLCCDRYADTSAWKKVLTKRYDLYFKIQRNTV